MLSTCLQEDLKEFERWLNFKNLSKHTILGYLSDLAIALDQSKIVTKEEIEQFSLDDWRRVLSTLQNRDLSSKSQDRYLASLNSFANYKKKQGILLNFVKLKIFRKKKQEILKLIQEEEVFQFLSFYDDAKTWLEKRDKALVYLLYSTGLRINEALSLKWKDLFARYINVRGKGGKLRTVPLFPFIKDMLLDYKKDAVIDQELIFWGAQKKTPLNACHVARKFRTVCLKLGLQKFSPHDLRHACASHLLSAGCNLRSIQVLLGHSSLELTKIYINLSEEDLKKKYFELS